MPLDFSSYGEPVEETKPSKGGTVDLSSYGEAVEEPEKEQDNSYNFKSAGKAAAESALPAMGGLAAGGAAAELGFAAGAAVGGPFAPVTAVIGGVLGGLGGAWGAAGAVNDVQNYLLDQIPEEVKAKFGFDKKTREKERKEDEFSTFTGELLPNALALRPGAATKTARVLGAAAMGGIESAQEAAQGEDQSLAKIATAAAFGAVSNKPTALGKKLGLKDHAPASKSNDPYDALSDLEKQKENQNKPTQGQQQELDLGKDTNSKFSEENQGELDFNTPDPDVFRKNNQRSFDFEQEPTGKEGDLFHPENVDRTQKSNLEGVTDRQQGEVPRQRVEPMHNPSSVVDQNIQRAQAEAAQTSGLPMPKDGSPALLQLNPAGEWLPAPPETNSLYITITDWVHKVTEEEKPKSETKEEHIESLAHEPPPPPKLTPKQIAWQKTLEERRAAKAVADAEKKAAKEAAKAVADAEKKAAKEAAEAEKEKTKTSKTSLKRKEKVQEQEEEVVKETPLDMPPEEEEKEPNFLKSKTESLFEENEGYEGDYEDSYGEGNHSDTYADPKKGVPVGGRFDPAYRQFKKIGDALAYLYTKGIPHWNAIIERILPFVKDIPFRIYDDQNIHTAHPDLQQKGNVGITYMDPNSPHYGVSLRSNATNDIVVLHEALHGATSERWRIGSKHENRNTPLGRAVRRLNLLKDKMAELAAKLENERFFKTMDPSGRKQWVSNTKEFIAYALSDGHVHQFLENMKGVLGERNGWDAFTKTVSKLLGFKENETNALQEVYSAINDLLEAEIPNNKPSYSEMFRQWISPDPIKQQTPKEWVAEKLREGPSREEFTKALMDKYGEQAAKFADRLYTERQVSISEMAIQAVKDVGKALRATKTITNIAGMDMMKHIQEMEKAGGDQKTLSRIQDHLDDPDKLSKADREIYDKYVKPMMDEESELYNRIRNISPDDPVANEFHAARMSAQKGWWARALEGLTSNPGTGGLMSKPSALKGRTMFQIRGTDGKVHIVHQGSDGTITLWNDKKASTFGVQKEGLKIGDKINGWVVEDVKNQRDIERHTNVKYVDNPAFVNGTKVVELKRYEAQLKALDEIMKSDVWKNNTSPSDNPLPGHVFLRNGDRVPMLKKFAFARDLAYELDDFLKPGPQPGSLSHTIMSINNMATKLFMLIPFVHMDNESVHWITSQGLSGMVSRDKTGNLLKGFQDVTRLSSEYREVAKAGGSLMYPRTKYDHMATEYLNKITASALVNPKFIEQLKQIGLVPLDFMDKVSQLSQNSMWLYRDALYMSIIRDHMSKGKNLQDAIKETDKYMPPYVVPTKVFGNRALAEAMQNPMISQFSAYHHGALSAIGNTLVNLASKGKRMEGLDHLAAYTFMLAAVYPLIDKMYQWTTGNPNEQIRRAGPFSYMKGAVDVFQGKTTPESYAQTMFTPAMVPYALYQTATNVDTFRKKEISNSQDPISLQVMDRLQFLGEKTVNPASVMQSGNKTWTEWALKQLADAEEDKTEENEAKRNRAMHKEKVIARKKMRDRADWQKEVGEWEKDLTE